jgi:glycosyl transferase family 2
MMTQSPFLDADELGDLPTAPRPVFSVVIGAYQAEATIARAVESALAQTSPPAEVIVCDDGSTDGTAAALLPYEAYIRIVRQENAGGAAALNTAVRHASGDFVSILDADDWYEPERLERLADLAAARPELDILVTDAHLVLDDKVVGLFTEVAPFAREAQRLAILDRCFILHPAVRRAALLTAGGFDESLRISYDWDCWLRLLFAGAVAGIVEEPLHNYRITPSSLSANRPATLRERVLMLEKAGMRQDLDAEERNELARSLATQRPRALLAEAEAALRSGKPGRRRAAAHVAVAKGLPLRTRWKSLAAAIAPRAAGRRLERRDAETGWSHVARVITGA